MPRRSPYAIRLSAERTPRAGRRARKYTSPYRDVIRAKIVLLAAEGFGNDRHRHATRYATPDREQMAPPVLRRPTTRALRKSLEAGAQPAFPPSVVVDVKRLACELPSHSDVPLARFSIPELHREVLARGIVAQISGVTLWRWLSADALATLASSQLDLSARSAVRREGRARAGSVRQAVGRDRRWDANEFVISADEKPSHPSASPQASDAGRQARLVRCASNTSTSGPVR